MINGNELIIYILFPGEGLNRFYMPIFTPVGVLGNILSFLVRKYFDLVGILKLGTFLAKIITSHDASGLPRKFV